MSEVEDLWERMKQNAILEGLDLDNPTCPTCNKRMKKEHICHDVKGKLVCAECADDEIQRITGCRFGHISEACDHLDCIAWRIENLT